MLHTVYNIELNENTKPFQLSSLWFYCQILFNYRIAYLSFNQGLLSFNLKLYVISFPAKQVWDQLPPVYATKQKKNNHFLIFPKAINI